MRKISFYCIILVFFFGYFSVVKISYADTSENLLQNSDAEDGEDEWSPSDWWTDDEQDGLSPYSGSYFFKDTASGYCSQTVDLSNYSTVIDSGNATFQISLWTSVWSDSYLDDQFSITIDYANEFGELIDTYSSDYISLAAMSDVWKYTELSDISIPVETRLIKFSIYWSNDSAYDDISLQIQWGEGDEDPPEDEVESATYDPQTKILDIPVVNIDDRRTMQWIMRETERGVFQLIRQIPATD